MTIGSAGRTDLTRDVPPSAIVVSGLPGAGKSTVSRLVAERLGRAAHVEADRLHEMIASGLVWPDGSPNPGLEANDQLSLRLRNACLLARSFVDSGFTALVDDVVIGARMVEALAGLGDAPRHVVVLAPPFASLRQRWIDMGSPFVERWAWLEGEMARTPRVGMWLDTSEMDASEVADHVVAHLDDAAVEISGP